MKIGIRKPSIKKSISSRISHKKQFIQRSGLKMPKNTGYLRSPKKYGYNKVYNKTTISTWDLFKKLFK